MKRVSSDVSEKAPGLSYILLFIYFKEEPQMKKTLTVLLALVLVIAMSVAGTMAYLTSTTDTVTNSFTVGNVAITLDEAKVNEYGEVDASATDRVKANTYKLIPGHSYTKDPTVHVAANSEDCYLFVKVEDGLTAIEAATTIATQLATNNWKPVDGVANVYVYAKGTDAKTAVPASTTVTDVPVFGSFTLTGTASVANYANAQIKVTAYAIQADGFAGKTPAAIWGDAGFT